MPCYTANNRKVLAHLVIVINGTFLAQFILLEYFVGRYQKTSGRRLVIFFCCKKSTLAKEKFVNIAGKMGISFDFQSKFLSEWPLSVTLSIIGHNTFGSCS